MSRSKKSDITSQRSDLRYKEIRRLLARKEREKRDQAENIIEEFYVDSNRMISVQMSADDDLRKMMQTQGIKSSLAGLDTGEPTARSYVKLAHYHMRAGRLENGLYYLEVSLSMDPESLLALTSLARCHLMLGHWNEAMKAAEIVMSKDKQNVAAILIKAESLFNMCFFEHALVMFHRGQDLAQDKHDFRLGIQKCQKTIKDSVADPKVFKVPGAKILFKLLATASELNETGEKEYVPKKKKNLGFKGLLNNLKAQAKEKTTDDGKDDDELSLQKLNIVEQVFFGGSVPKIDVNAEKEKAEESAKNKAQLLFGDAKERSKAKKKEKQGNDEEDGEAKKVVKKKPKESMTQMLMKAELRTVEDDMAKKKVAKKKKSEVKPKKKRVLTNGDRLLDDKVYLSMLAEGGIGVRTDLASDYVNEDVAYEAKEALDFLTAREKFWDQVELGNENKRGGSGKKKDHKTLESLRWLM